MIKKITVWILYAGIVGLLVFGAVNRTEAKAGAGTGGSKSGSDSRDYPARRQEDQVVGEGAGRQLEAGGSRAGSEIDSNRDSQPEAERYEMETLQGAVRSISSEQLEIGLAGSEVLLIDGQAWRYAIAQGFETDPGHRIEFSGFFEDGEYKLSWMRDLDTELGVEVRDPSGRPLWAGRYYR